MSRPFESSQELLEAVADLMTRLEAGGHVQALAEIRAGHRCLNGLTDGWALFLAAIEKVETTHALRWPRDEQKALKLIVKAVHAAVYGRRR
ncbi:MAG TPA: hypothetical protein VFD82_01325 [Planctomycetota bacterium]|nr:hypothetical protein [Planctomycetota bacterium]